MKKFIALIALLLTVCIHNVYAQDTKNSTVSSNAGNTFITTSSGLQYKIIKDSAGAIYPEVGGYITFWFEIRTDKDSIIDSQFSDPNPVGIPTPETFQKPGIEEGFLLITEGDSAVFILNADSLYNNTFKREIPEYLQSGSTIHMIVKMGKMYSKHFVDSVMALQAAEALMSTAEEQKAFRRDSIIIQKYLTEHKLKGKEIDGGVYIVKLKNGSKKTPYIVKGEIVETKYIGKLLIEGTVFDQSAENEYFEFTVGIGQVIKGWDYAFQRLKLGEKALILIPSGAAYGDRGAGNAIPPNAPLLFEVEIKNE